MGKAGVAVGGYAGAKAGLAVGGPVGLIKGAVAGAVGGALVGGTIGAVGSSYSAHIGIESALKSGTPSDLPELSLDRLLAAYLFATTSGDGMGLRALRNDYPTYTEGIDIQYPNDSIAEIATSAGVVHNISLNYLVRGEKTEKSTLRDLTEIERIVIESEEFKRDLKQVLASSYHGGGIGLLKEYTDDQNKKKMDYVLMLFFEVFQQSEGIREITELVNKYIEVIQRSEELSNEDKQLIYNSLSVATHSYNYWSKNEKHP